MKATKQHTAPGPVAVTKFEDGKPTGTEIIKPTINAKELTMNAPAQATASSTNETKSAPKAPKVPAESKLVRDSKVKLGRKLNDGETLGHHQKDVIFGVAHKIAKDGLTSVAEIVKTIQGDKELVSKMNTVQPIERCVRYHLKSMTSAGLFSVEKIEQPKAEKPAKAEAPTTGKPAKAEPPAAAEKK